MKLKGINPLEQNADKIVVGVVGLVLLGVAASQLLANRSVLKVGSETTTAGGAYAPAERAARELAARLDAAAPTLPEPPPFTLGGKMAFGAPAGPAPVRVSLGRPPLLGAAGTGAQAAKEQFSPISIPAPTAVAVHAFRSTIDPVERTRNADLAKLLPAAQPFDKAAVSVEASFSGQGLRDALAADPDGPEGPLAPVPLSWWRDPQGRGEDMVGIIGVQLERQTLRLPDGTTPAAPQTVIIADLPGRPSLLRDWGTEVRSIGDVPGLVDTARYEAEDVLRPSYYTTVAGPEWAPPSESAAGGAAGQGQKRAIFRKRLADVDAKLLDLQQRLGQPGREGERGPGGRPGDDRAPGGRPGEDPAPTRPGEGGPGGRRPGASPEDRAPDRAAPNRAVLEQQVRVQTAQRARLAKQLEDLGEKVAAPAAPGTLPAFVPLLDSPEIKVWMHDLTAEPGAAYRYRLRVAVNNPYFGRNLQEGQQPLAQDSLLYGAWSAWGAETPILRDEYFFLTSAETDNPISPRPRASGELYKFYYGFYRVASVSLEPGDAVAGDARIPELKLADMARVEAAETPAGSPAVTPGAAPGRPGEAAPPAAAAGTDTGYWTVAGPKSIDLSVDAVFLDVAPTPSAEQGLAGESRERFMAFLRTPYGDIETRLPDAERGSLEYRLVRDSATAGTTQGAVEEKVAEPTRPLGPKPRAPAAPRPGGGGGGG